MYLFVYGTLMNGYGLHSYYLGTAVFQGVAETVDNFSLRVGGSIPYLHDDEALYPILGEVYKITNAKTLRELDGIEGHPHWYQRKPVQVRCGGRVLTAEAYFNNAPGTLLPDGNFRNLKRS